MNSTVKGGGVKELKFLAALSGISRRGVGVKYVYKIMNGLQFFYTGQ